MAFRRSIRNRRGRHKIHKDFELQLTSMMDILVIILVFLLKSYCQHELVFFGAGPSASDLQNPGNAARQFAFNCDSGSNHF